MIAMTYKPKEMWLLSSTTIHRIIRRKIHKTKYKHRVKFKWC